MKQRIYSRWTATLKKMFLLCGVAAIILPFTACEEQKDEKPNVTVIIGTLGKGNNDYCSLVYKGIEAWSHNPEIDMVIQMPKTVEEATALYKDWAKKTAKGKRSLMVVANSEYKDMVQNNPLELKSNQQVLAFEMILDKPVNGVHTFQTSHSGIAYLTGTLAAFSKDATVVLGIANPLLSDASKNFQDGFRAYKNKDAQYVELSQDFDGFDMPDQLYEMVKKEQYRHHFILPLAGKSNEGVYTYLKECEKNDPENEIISVGVDVDRNADSPRIAFSYLINIDKAIGLYLQAWVDGKPWPNTTLGLEDGITEIKFNPDFKTIGEVTMEGMQARYKENFDKAVAKDRK